MTAVSAAITEGGCLRWLRRSGLQLVCIIQVDDDDCDDVVGGA